LVGPHDYCTALQLWAEKTGRQISDDDDDNPAMRRGRLLEAVAADIAADELSEAKVAKNGLEYYRDGTLKIGATPDLFVEHDERGPGVLEIKNVEPSIYRMKWPNDEPPLWIGCQTLTAAKLVGAEWAGVGVLRVGHGVDFHIVPVPLHAGAWQALQDAVGAFWQSVITDTPPAPDYTRDHEILKRLNPISEPFTLDLSDDKEFTVGVAERIRLKSAVAEYEKQIDRLDSMILHRAGTAEAVMAGDYRVTLKTQDVAGYTVKPRTQRPIRVYKRKAAA
jgi:hypothetical protein